VYRAPEDGGVLPKHVAVNKKRVKCAIVGFNVEQFKSNGRNN
jgi:hypothetical protein